MNPKFEVIEALYKAHANKYITRFARSTGSQAAGEDVVHTAFERALKYVDAYDPEQEIERWFALILRNSYRDYMKEERGQETEFLDEFDHQGAECDGLIRRIWKEIQDMIDDTIPAHKEILTYHFVHGYTITDISKFTDHTMSNISQVISRFRIKVRELYVQT